MKRANADIVALSVHLCTTCGVLKVVQGKGSGQPVVFW
jgi:hypothetical protein